MQSSSVSDVTMLKKLVRERLIEAADEIFGLFERTIASYEEQLCRAREETERQRQQRKAVCETNIVLCAEDVQVLAAHQEELPVQLQHSSSNSEEEESLQHSLVKEEEPQPHHVVEEEKHQQPLHGKDNENGPSPELLQLHPHSPSGDHSGGPPPGDRLAPLPDIDETKELCRSDVTSAGHWKRTSQMRPKRFTCSVCGKTFSQKARFTAHRRTHEQERRFSCSMCHKTFIQKASLVSHMRMHTGEKPFSCPVCGKTFTRKDCMETHVRIHTGEKPFACSFCGRAFTLKQNMFRHMRMHTG
ncbi:zinc finger protein 777-like isoform X2 [Hippocampus zosterae]|uniref:zinc finger protein 777-like isoform X2 n=1 Tax=Hippocampus zosterae TaxID=109293 RepID=UPI00223E4118|nr:zinc finger protein 777-like isoform X2 [Hippocampus zosterae]